MAAAIAEARASVRTFLEELARRREDWRYMVKARVEADGHVELLWLEPVSYNGSAFAGPIANTPFKITSIKAGDPLSVRSDEIVDWAVLDAEGDFHAGGFTQRVMDARKDRTPD